MRGTLEYKYGSLRFENEFLKNIFYSYLKVLHNMISAEHAMRAANMQ